MRDDCGTLRSMSSAGLPGKVGEKWKGWRRLASTATLTEGERTEDEDMAFSPQKPSH